MTPRANLTLGKRGGAAVRYLVLAGRLVGAVGVAGRWLTRPMLPITIGPTAYVFAAHRGSKFQSARIGHGSPSAPA